MFLDSTFPSVHVDSIIFTANKIKANHAGYLHHVSSSFAHDLSSSIVTGVKQIKSNTEYYIFKAIFIENDEDWLHLTTGAPTEGGIWNKGYCWTPFGISIPKLTEINKTNGT